MAVDCPDAYFQCYGGPLDGALVHQSLVGPDGTYHGRVRTTTYQADQDLHFVTIVWANQGEPHQYTVIYALDAGLEKLLYSDYKHE